MQPFAAKTPQTLAAMARLDAAVRHHDFVAAAARWRQRLTDAPACNAAPEATPLQPADVRTVLEALSDVLLIVTLLERAGAALEPVARLARMLDFSSPAASWSDDLQAIAYQRPGNAGEAEQARFTRSELREAREAYLALQRYIQRPARESEEGRAEPCGSHAVSEHAGGSHGLV